MGAVVKFFVRAKHWQIFLLLFGIGYVGGSTAMLLSLTTARSPEEFLKISLPFGFVMVLFMLCLAAWLWSMGSFLNSIGQPALRLRLGFFRFALLYPTVYIFIFLALFGFSPSVFGLSSRELIDSTRSPSHGRRTSHLRTCLIR